MTYCKKCSRILEDDSDICPYCGAEESNPTQTSGNDIYTSHSYESSTCEKNPYEENSYEEKNIFESILGASTDDQLSELNELINKNKKQQEITVSHYYEESFSNDNRPIQPEVVDTPEPEKEFDSTLKVIMILLTILFPFVGLILAILFMSSKAKSCKSLGKILLIISLVEFGIGILCCCGIGLLGYFAY